MENRFSVTTGTHRPYPPQFPSTWVGGAKLKVKHNYSYVLTIALELFQTIAHFNPGAELRNADMREEAHVHQSEHTFISEEPAAVSGKAYPLVRPSEERGDLLLTDSTPVPSN